MTLLYTNCVSTEITAETFLDGMIYSVSMVLWNGMRDMVVRMAVRILSGVELNVLGGQF
jgi:hypothetical protein